MLSVFLGNNLKCKVILFLIFTTNFISGKILVLELWAKMLSAIKLQDSLKCNISRKKEMMKFIFGIQINIKVFCKLILSFWVCATRHGGVQPGMPKVPKIKTLHIFAIYPEKTWGGGCS